MQLKHKIRKVLRYGVWNMFTFLHHSCCNSLTFLAHSMTVFRWDPKLISSPYKFWYIIQYWLFGQKFNCAAKQRNFIFCLPGLRFCTTKLIASPDAVILRLCFSPWSLWSENTINGASHVSGRMKYIRFLFIPEYQNRIFVKTYLEGYYILWHNSILESFHCVVQPS